MCVCAACPSPGLYFFGTQSEPNLRQREPSASHHKQLRLANAVAKCVGFSHQAHVPKSMLGSCSLSATEPAIPPRREYARAGHAKKLEPIIQSLDYYDHDPEAWRGLRTSVKLMADGWTELLGQVPCDTEVYMALAAQRDRCIEALRVQSAMFQSHRQICAMALKLQETQAR